MGLHGLPRLILYLETISMSHIPARHDSLDVVIQVGYSSIGAIGGLARGSCHDHALFDNFAVIAYSLLYRVRNNQKKFLALRCREVLTRATPIFTCKYKAKTAISKAFTIS